MWYNITCLYLEQDDSLLFFDLQPAGNCGAIKRNVWPSRSFPDAFCFAELIARRAHELRV